MSGSRNAKVLGVLLFIVITVLPLGSSLATASLAGGGSKKLAPYSYITQFGSTGGQPVTNLATISQTGTQDNPSAYVTFTTPNVLYRGYRTYFLPVNILRGSVSTLTVKVNYKGPASASQTWTWYLYDWIAMKWVKIGNNSTATANQWKLLTFNPTAPIRFINKNTREIRLLVRSNNASGNAKLDYESVWLGYNFTPTPMITMTPPLTGISRPDHVVIVVEENHDYSQIFADACCTYINAQAAAGALMTNSHAVEHPSQPNYLDLFSGSNQGITDSTCPLTFSTANLGQELIAAGLTFGGYAEDLPAVGSTVCSAPDGSGGSSGYVRRHTPWVNFSNVPSSANMPLTSFPSDFSQLPTVSIIIPNLCSDMHDCSPATGDAWLQSHLDAYIQWAQTHNSLFILTFDENTGTAGNQVVTIFEGPMVIPGQYNEYINHFTLLRTLEDMYGLPHAGESANVAPIMDIWVVDEATPTPTPTPGG